ncbi:hypothetical protein ACS0TY_003685 [Phlomoides rotata]
MLKSRSRKLRYLHGALCESLRLFPPVALEHKAPIRADVLPSGHYLGENAKLIFSFYSVGRMESVWRKRLLRIGKSDNKTTRVLFLFFVEFLYNMQDSGVLVMGLFAVAMAAVTVVEDEV